jgi:hypothetical protein
MGLASVSFPGIVSALGGEMTFRRGVKPSFCTLWMVPQDNLSLPAGTLRFEQDGVIIEFRDARIDTGFLRMKETAKGQRWAIQIADRRWKWRYGSIDGEYNVRLPDGRVDESEKKTPKDLAEILLKKLGEDDYDISEMPTNVWPYVKWEGTLPAEALQKLCDYVACDVVLNPLTNKIHIVALGTGITEGEIETLRARHNRYRIPMRRRPATIKVLCGPTRFQQFLATDPIGHETDYTQEKIADLSYEPEDWSDESPWSYPGVTNDDERAATFEALWKWYRVSGVLVDGEWAVPGSETAITELKQILPLRHDLIDNGEDLDDIKRAAFPYMTGDFWAYGDGATNTFETRYTGPFTLRHDRGVVEFPWPVFKLGSSQFPEEAVVRLMASFNIRNEDGDFDRVTRSMSGGGEAGELVLLRPEIFAAKSPTVDTFADAEAEADSYLEMFVRKYSGPLAQEREHASILPFVPDGRLAEVRWSCAKNRYGLTKLGYRDEFDVFA